MSYEKKGLLHSRSRSKQRFKMSVNVLSVYFLNWKQFVTKLGVVVHHHESESHAKRLVCYLQGHGHSKGSYDRNMTVSNVSSELLILLQPNLV